MPMDAPDSDPPSSFTGTSPSVRHLSSSITPLLFHSRLKTFLFTARCYASAVLAMGLCLCLSVCLCLCLSQVSVLLKRLNIGSQKKQHHAIAHRLSFSDAKDLLEIRVGSPPTRAPNAGGVGKNRRLLTNNRLYLENGER